MMHFVLSRAFRDSLLGSDLRIVDLPKLTAGGTLLAITLSLLLSFFIRTRERVGVVRVLYLCNAITETLMAIFYVGHSWIYSAYYIEVSASTALGLSLVWVLIGDWTTRCYGRSSDRIPSILISGTTAGMFAGLVLVHIPGILSFRTANLVLAGMHLFVAGALGFYNGDVCLMPVFGVQEVLSKGLTCLTKNIVRWLAVVIILGAATSTLLDLLFRVSIARFFAEQASRFRLLGMFQSLQLLGVMVAQMLMRRLRLRSGVGALHVHPLLVGSLATLSSFVPGAWTMGFLRSFEYSLRNSAFRTGTERIYLLLPDELRVESRPLIDVIGERVGDMVAAGMLQILFLTGTGIVVQRKALVAVAACSGLLYLLCRRLEGKADLIERPFDRARDDQGDVPLNGVAREKSVLV